MAVESFQQAFAAAAVDAPGLDAPGLDAPGVDGLGRDFVLRWLAGLQAAIADAAAAAGAEAKDYACTLLGAVIGDAAALYVQIGDGAIVVAPDRMGEDRQEAVFWPQHGEFANSTFFVTMDDAAYIIQVERRATPPGGVRDLAMFSDGLERLILDMTARTVHAPALRSIFGWLAATAPAAPDASSPVLAAFLDSANVNRRTDDDKTLIVATRAAPAEPAEP